MTQKNIGKLLKQYEDGKVPGCAVLVAKDNQIVFQTTHGYADIENDVVVSEMTNFRLASVTKHIMAVAIMVLVQDSKITLKDALEHFFDELPDYMKQITLLHLLAHTSGLPHYEALMTSSDSQIHDAEVLALLMKQQYGLFRVGEKYDYNNGAFCILRLVIEKTSGQSIDVFLRERIFTKLGMDNTVVNYQGTTAVPHRAFGYTCENDVFKLTDQDTTSATIGDGGVYSSLHDLQKWGAVFYTDVILSQESREHMLDMHVHTDENGTYYGLGLFLKNINGKRVAFHGGSSIGFRNGILYIPGDKVTVVFLSNRSEGDGSVMVHTIIRELHMCD